MLTEFKAVIDLLNGLNHFQYLCGENFNPLVPPNNEFYQSLCKIR